MFRIIILEDSALYKSIEDRLDGSGRIVNVADMIPVSPDKVDMTLIELWNGLFGETFFYEPMPLVIPHFPGTEMCSDLAVEVRWQSFQNECQSHGSW